MRKIIVALLICCIAESLTLTNALASESVESNDIKVIESQENSDVSEIYTEEQTIEIGVTETDCVESMISSIPSSVPDVAVIEKAVSSDNNDKIDTNLGIIDENNGEISVNAGIVKDNNADVLTNTGSVINNDGNVTLNTGMIAENNGTVTNNSKTGKVIVNSEEAVIENNKGEISLNNGTVTDNKGSVSVNTGTVTNYENGVVGLNAGIVNNYGGEVVENAGTVNQFYSVEIKVNNTKVSYDSGFEKNQGKAWIDSTGSGEIVVKPKKGFKIDKVDTKSMSGVSVKKNSDGSLIIKLNSVAQNSTNKTLGLRIVTSAVVRSDGKVEVHYDSGESEVIDLNDGAVETMEPVFPAIIDKTELHFKDGVVKGVRKNAVPKENLTQYQNFAHALSDYYKTNIGTVVAGAISGIRGEDNRIYVNEADYDRNYLSLGTWILMNKYPELVFVVKYEGSGNVYEVEIPGAMDMKNIFDKHSAEGFMYIADNYGLTYHIA